MHSALPVMKRPEAAVAWLLAHDAAQDGTASRRSQRRARLHLPGLVAVDAVNEDVEGLRGDDDAENDDVEAERDAMVLARRPACLLTRAEARVPRQRCEGGVIATAHAREKAAGKKVSAFVRRADVPVGALRRIVRKGVA